VCFPPFRGGSLKKTKRSDPVVGEGGRSLVFFFGVGVRKGPGLGAEENRGKTNTPEGRLQTTKRVKKGGGKKGLQV